MATRIKCYFFTGRPSDRSGVVGRTRLDGFDVLVLVSPRATNVPEHGQKWEVELERKLFSCDPRRKTAVALGLPLRHLPEVEVPRVAMGFEKKFRRGHGSGPVEHPVVRAEALRTVRTTIAPPTTRAPERRHRRSELDRQIRRSMKNGGKETGGKKKQKTA